MLTPLMSIIHQNSETEWSRQQQMLCHSAQHIPTLYRASLTLFCVLLSLQCAITRHPALTFSAFTAIVSIERTSAARYFSRHSRFAELAFDTVQRCPGRCRCLLFAFLSQRLLISIAIEKADIEIFPDTVYIFFIAFIIFLIFFRYFQYGFIPYYFSVFFFFFRFSGFSCCLFDILLLHIFRHC